MENAITYLLRKYYTVGSQNYRIFYDFQSSGAYVNNITGNTGMIGNIVGSNTGNFFSNSGLANFSGNSLYIDNSSENIDVTDCTYFLTYQNKCSKDFSLINCIETGSYNNSIYYKGYEFGVTANNYLYFNYYNQSGSQVFISSSSLSDKSNVFLSVENNSVGFGSYDFVGQNLKADLFSIDSKYLFNPSGLWFSSNLEYTGLYNKNSPFIGTMERCLVFSPSIPLSDIRLLNSGSVSNYISGGYIVTYTSGSQITGYTTGLLPYYTGITGSTFGATGTITDVFGTTYSGFGQVNLTGVLYSQQLLPQYGVVSIPQTGRVLESIVLNTGVIKTYGKSNINVLLNIQSGDNINLVYNTGIQDIFNQRNLASKYANGFNYYTWINSNRSSYNVWTDGLYQYSGNTILSGDIYNITNTISGDYIVDNKGNIFFGNSFGNSDYVKIDIIYPDQYTSLYIDNFNLAYTGLIILDSKYYLNWPKNSEIFLNGQKLISGIDSEIGVSADYGITGSGIYFKNTGLFYNLLPSVLSATVISGIVDQVSYSNIINSNNSIIKYELAKSVEIIKKMSIINENLSYCNNDNMQTISFLSIFYL